MPEVQLHLPKDCLQAKEMLSQVFPTSLATMLPPSAKLQNLARRLDVREIITRPIDISGMLVPADDGYVIVLKEADSTNMQRYTIAHEIGHLVYGKLKGGKENVSSQLQNEAYRHGHGDKREERVCEAIAAEILMPAEEFHNRLSHYGFSLESVTKLAAAFGTSITATALRFWELMNMPALIIKWEINRKRGKIVFPVWQRRNEIDGPNAKVLVSSRGDSGPQFMGPTEAFSSDGMKISEEALLTTTSNNGRSYTGFPSYLMESMGFGARDRRFAISVAYLGDN